ELESNRPARGTRREAEQLAQRQLVDLGNRSVDLVRQVVAMLLPMSRKSVDTGEIVDHAHLGIDREPEAAEKLECLVMAGELGPADDLSELVAPEAQLATRRDAGILLAQAACAGVA